MKQYMAVMIYLYLNINIKKIIKPELILQTQLMFDFLIMNANIQNIKKIMIKLNIIK